MTFKYRGIEIHTATEVDNSYGYWAFVPQAEGVLCFDSLEEARLIIDLVW